MTDGGWHRGVLLVAGCWLLVAVLAACTAAPTDATTATTSSATVATTFPAGSLDGFERRGVVVSGAPWTVAVADTPALRSQGLMGIADLGDLSGMLFVFDDDTDAGFWMKDTLIPLDVAFFTVDGGFVDLLSMVPCVDDPCPTYHASGPYRYALEADSGAFAAMDRPSLGFTEG